MLILPQYYCGNRNASNKNFSRWRAGFKFKARECAVQLGRKNFLTWQPGWEGSSMEACWLLYSASWASHIFWWWARYWNIEQIPAYAVVVVVVVVVVVDDDNDDDDDGGGGPGTGISSEFLHTHRAVMKIIFEQKDKKCINVYYTSNGWMRMVNNNLQPLNRGSWR